MAILLLLILDYLSVLTHTQHDPIGDLLSSKYPDIPRKPLLSVEHVSMDAEGLRRLVVSCSKWQVVVAEAVIKSGSVVVASSNSW